MRISNEEWLVFAWTIRPLLTSLKDSVICWQVDNMNVYQAWLNSGSIRDSWLKKEVVEMQILLHEQNTEVIPVHIRLAQQLHTDLISRKKVMPDWHLDRSIAQKLFQLLG